MFLPFYVKETIFCPLQSLMDDNFSIHLPAVSSPVKALQSLKKGFEGKVHEVMTAAGVDDLDLDPGMMNLIIVHLSPAAGVKSEEEAIASNGELERLLMIT